MNSQSGQETSVFQDFERRCREQGLSLTAQRRLVYQCLAGRRDHPTADQVFEETRRALPEISKATVYRVLETLVEVGVVRKVNHPDSAARFDGNPRRHHHLVCTACGRIADVEETGLKLRIPAGISGGRFKITDYSINFQGVCAPCQHGKEQ